ncbi:metallophosphoesterase family protein [Ktedonospora formicarum]|uniref:Serine/threonine protein phosphatase n=1 Tax=Ktedonospora formicarum TaxID=2778364 RepID=A0A8J3MVV3_9CHLR|nr:metallophosphoesterase family protein [Ktedonospora formicarum]GHO46895.1 serine/threonine protein phosphatase [Ktedonospora formicarum]
MRIGLIADIHGNLVALECVLSELQQEQVDHIICLGDVAALGPQPHEVLERLRMLNCPVVLGNTDDWYLQPVPDGDEELREIVHWGLQQFTEADLEYLRSFQPVIELRLDTDKSLLCFHGSPRSYNEVIASTTSSSEMRSMFAGHQAWIMAGGHTHVQMLRRFEQALLINPGSVGLPGVGPESKDLQRNKQVRWAEYAILTLRNGHISVDLRRIPLDIPTLLQIGYASGMPDINSWVRAWDTLGEAP